MGPTPHHVNFRVIEGGLLSCPSVVCTCHPLGLTGNSETLNSVLVIHILQKVAHSVTQKGSQIYPFFILNFKNLCV